MNRFDREEGIALITALLGVLILGSLAMIFVSRALTENDASAFSRDFETAIHAAEAAGDARIADMNVDDLHVTYNLGGDGEPTVTDADKVANDSFDSQAQERQWVLDQREAPELTTGAWQETRRGEGYAFRPAFNGEPLNLIYAVGAVPSFEHPDARIRVIKLRVGRDFYNPRAALLTGGDLTFGGNASILAPDCLSGGDGCIADVHVNGGFTNPGGASRIEGKVVVSGGSCPSSIDAVGGCVDQGAQAAPLPTPEFQASDFYGRTLTGDITELGDTDWYDLCSDGTVRPISAAGPCESTEVRWPDDETNASNYLGWTYKASQNEWQANALESGIFYVHHADANVNGTAPGEQSVSILLEMDPDNKTGSGSLSLGGNPQADAALDDILFIADGDLEMRGTPTSGSDACAGIGASYGGFIGVHEQLRVQGNVRLVGAIIAKDEATDHGLVTHQNAGVSGNMCLEYDPNLALDFTGVWVVRYWSEL